MSKVFSSSKKIPEVGDIWEIYDPNARTYRAIVVNTSDFVHPYCVTDDYQGAFLWGYTTETYIGKSKAKLSDGAIPKPKDMEVN